MDPMIVGGLVAGGLNLAGDLVSQTNARSAFKTRYQDTVKDMRKAGLNPALAYGQGGGNPQTHPIGDVGTAAAEGGAKVSSAKQAQANMALVQAQTDLLRTQAQDLATITKNRAKESNFLPDRAMFKNMSTEARAIMDMIHQRQTEATNLSDVRARLSANEMQTLQTELTRLSIPEARALAKWFSSPVGRNERSIDKILEVIRAIRGGGAKTYTTNNYIPGRR